MSGDNQEAVAETANKLKIKKFFCDLKPHEKMNELENLMQNSNNKKIMFVGDGLNDSAVLKCADVGIAIQKLENSSHAATSAADIVILGDGVEKTADIIKIARAIKRIAEQNIFMAVGFKLIIMLVTALIYQSMELAIIADVGVATLCVLNSLRVLRI